MTTRLTTPAVFRIANPEVRPTRAAVRLLARVLLAEVDRELAEEQEQGHGADEADKDQEHGDLTR